MIGDDNKRDAYYRGYDYATRAKGATVNSGEHYRNDPANTTGVGADANILKYTGNLTDALTLTALVGRSTSKHENYFDGYDVFDLSKSIAQVITSPSTIPFPISNNQPLSGNIMPKGGKDVVKSTRIDLEYKLGSHTLRAAWTTTSWTRSTPASSPQAAAAGPTRSRATRPWRRR
jgi:hypothetical protein